MQTALTSFFKPPPAAPAAAPPPRPPGEPVDSTSAFATFSSPGATAKATVPMEGLTPSPLRPAPAAADSDDDMPLSVMAAGGGARVVAPGRSLKRRRKVISYAESDEEADDGEDGETVGPKGVSALTRVSKAPRRRVVSDSDDEFVLDDDLVAAAEAAEAAAEAAVAADAASLDNPLAELASEPVVPAQPARAVARRASASSASSSSGMLTTKEMRRREAKKKFVAANTNRFSFLVDRRDKEGRREGEPGFDPSTLYIPERYYSGKGKDAFTGFEKQYWKIKADHFDTVLFVQKGKFYELFEEDADIAHQLLDLKLTERVNMRMCGVPEAHFQKWAAQLIAHGYKVARVAQAETKIGSDIAQKDGTKAKGKNLIRRELKQILTSGTLVSEDMLATADARYLLALAPLATPYTLSVAFVDCATGKFATTLVEDDEHLTLLETLLVQIKPSEVLYERGVVAAPVLSLLKVHVPTASALVALTPDSQFWSVAAARSWVAAHVPDIAAPGAAALANDATARSLGGLFYYLDKLQLGVPLVSQGSFEAYDVIRSATSLVMDGQTLFNLNVLNNSSDGSVRGTLLELAGFCVSPFGKRAFRAALAHPLASAAAIADRQDAVETLRNSQELTDVLTTLLTSVPDLERLLSRIHTATCPLHKFVAVLRAFERIANTVSSRLAAGTVAGDAARATPVIAAMLAGPLAALATPLAALRTAFDWDAALQQNQIVPRPGVHPAFDALLAELAAVDAGLDAHLADVRAELGVAVTYTHINKEMYQLTVPAKTRVPPSWVLKSQKKSEKRYWSPYLAATLPARDETRERLRLASVALLAHFERQFAADHTLYAAAVADLAALDVLLSLKTFSLALAEPKCRPTLLDTPVAPGAVPTLNCTALRHPCVRVTRAASFVPNDVAVGGDGPGALLLTGPNMGGKSTLLRSVCVAVILAQMGAYVPAAAMELHPVDRIFTRIGAHDHIMRGQSTFMVELLETASVLKHGTASSLVVMDELGRGTSTFDGYAIAYAVLSALLDSHSARTLFSTHYHALCDEFADHPAVSLQHMTCYVDEAKDQVTFLYKLAPGVASKSYGMNVAKLAGVADAIVARASAKAAEFEAESPMYEFRAEYSSLSPADRAFFRALAARSG